MSFAEATTALIDGLPIDSSKTEVLLGITAFLAPKYGRFYLMRYKIQTLSKFLKEK